MEYRSIGGVRSGAQCFQILVDFLAYILIDFFNLITLAFETGQSPVRGEIRVSGDQEIRGQDTGIPGNQAKTESLLI
jgi:hypothetical protein